ncbi:hypothetical protein [Sinomonas terrae]|uniref:Conjugal transfer protein TrbL n=1 Tax=Sinomonas terrae TaxID=2908838 RepID=A0ABS9U294_9MICC|nr:hypothetical protein [Sinomonas terrae]MCH6470768.1 hypothetical protein [Sinomonas terrae]
MRTLSARTRAVAAALIVVFSFGVVSAQAAYAADPSQPQSSNLNADEMKRLAGLPPAQRSQIRDSIVQKLSQDACGINALHLALPSSCEQDTAKAFGMFLTTPEQALAYSPAQDGASLCSAYMAIGNPAASMACRLDNAVASMAPIAGSVLKGVIAASPGGQFILGTMDVIGFISNPKDGFEQFANTVKADGVKATSEVVQNLTKTTAFSIDDGFRDTWAAFSAIGLVILALMYFKLWKDAAKDEDIDLDEVRRSLLWYGPLSVVLVLFGPAIGHVVNDWFAGFTEAFTDWTATRIAAFMEVVSRFASYQSNGAFGPLAAVILFGLLFLGAWGLLGTLFLQPFALYMIGLGIALAIGFLAHPAYRARVAKMSTLWLAICLSKPLLILLVGAVFVFVAGQPAFKEGVDDALVNASSVFIAAAAMLGLAFAPMGLFKWVPLLPSASTSIGAGRSSVVGAAAVAGAGAGLSSLIRQQRSIFNRGQDAGRVPVQQGHGTGPAGPPAGEPRGRRSALQTAGRVGAVTAKTAGKVASGGAAAFLLAGREAARTAARRGRTAAESMAPNTDHISGR